jgi:hypothetical protein
VGDSRVGQQLTLSLLDELLWFEKLTGCVAMSHMKGDTITVRLDDDLLPILDEVHALPLDALMNTPGVDLTPQVDYFFELMSINGTAPPVTFGIFPFHF